MSTHGAVPIIATAAASTGGNGTLTTPQGPINWIQSADGTIQAEGGGQTLTVTRQDESDGSWQSHAQYAQTGQPPYLSMDLVGDVAGRKVEFTLAAGSSQLTLTVANIDALVTSGNATLSGTWNGAAVNWTGSADLTSNPFVSRPIAAWPTGAFASQLQQAAFFAPLANQLAQTMVAAAQGTNGNGRTAYDMSPEGVLGRAASWCLGGAMAGAGAAPGTLGTTMVLGCVGSGGASILSDLWTWIYDGNPSPLEPIDPPFTFPDPPDDLPVPVQYNPPDDPPPPAPDGAGGGGGGGQPGGGDEQIDTDGNDGADDNLAGKGTVTKKKEN